MGAQKRAFRTRPEPHHGDGARRGRHSGFLAPVSHSEREEPRRDKAGNSGSAHAYRLLCGLAQGMGGVPHGDGSLRRGRRREMKRAWRTKENLGIRMWQKAEPPSARAKKIRPTRNISSAKVT